MCAKCENLNGNVHKPNENANSCFECEITGCDYCNEDSKCHSCTSTDELPDETATSCVRCTMNGCMYCNEADKCESCLDQNGVSYQPDLDKSECIQC